MRTKSPRLLSESGRLLFLTSLLLIAAGCANWAQDEYDYYRSLPAVSGAQTSSTDEIGAVDDTHMALLRMQFNGAEPLRNSGAKSKTLWNSTADGSSDTSNRMELLNEGAAYGSNPNLQPNANLRFAPGLSGQTGSPEKSGTPSEGFVPGIGMSSIGLGSSTPGTSSSSSPW